MSKRQALANDVAEALFEAEAAIDDAVCKAGRLLAILPQTRIEAGLSAVSGQVVFQAAAKACGSLTEARGAMVEGHNGLEALRRAMKLEAPALTVGVLGVDKPPVGASTGLSVVQPSQVA